MKKSRWIVVVAAVSLPLVVLLGVTHPRAAVAQGHTQDGAVLGGVTGAIAGGIIGHQNDETPEGAIIGGVVGAVTGGLLGNSKDARIQRQQQYVYQQQQIAARALSMADVINMSRSGLSDAVIISHIQSNGVQRRLETHDIITLHQNGVREPVINAMQRMTNGHTIRARPPEVYPPARQPTVVLENRYYVPHYAPPIRVYHPPYRRHYHHHPHRRGGWHVSLGW